MNVVAEGVETERQMEYWAANDCECIQGYIFSKPLKEEEVIKLPSGKSVDFADDRFFDNTFPFYNLQILNRFN